MATMGRGPEREIPHTGTETRTRLLREAAVRNIGSGFFIDDMTIVTNRHVIENAKNGRAGEINLTVASQALGGEIGRAHV